MKTIKETRNKCRNRGAKRIDHIQKNTYQNKYSGLQESEDEEYADNTTTTKKLQEA